MTNRGFLAALEQILELPAGSLTGDEQLDDIASWDSLAIMSVISMVDEKLGVLLQPRDLQACQTIAGLTRLVQPALSEE